MINHTLNLILKNKISLVLILGFLVRVLFCLFGASVYYGTENFYKGGDTNWWIDNIANLINHGVYTDELNTEYGYFTRLPGYSFFIGIFYLLSGKKIILTYKLVAYCQILLDTLAIYLVNKISISTFKNETTALITSLLYALYPFIIVWNVIVYAESLSVFLFLLSIYFLLKKPTTANYALSGFLLGISILTRIQLIVFLPIVVLALLFTNYKIEKKIWNKQTVWFCLLLALTYGSWPVRNYVFHNKIIFSQHLGDKKHWAPDRIYFTSYLWAVKTDIEPQFSQVMKNQTVEFPKASYIVKGDSLKLATAVKLMRECGEGLSYFRESEGIATGHVEKGKDCNEQIVSIFKELIQNQKQQNPLNYYIWVPLNNLKKALFKFSLTEEKQGLTNVFINLVFLYRTILLLLGIIGLIILFQSTEFKFSILPLAAMGYFLLWYFFHSFYYRNMEIRYLLHADILLIYPAAFFINHVIEKFRIKKAN